MDEVEKLLNLPLETLAVLAAGYMAYRIAYTGRDESHKTVDTVFISFVFALIAKVIIVSVQPFNPSDGAWDSISAFVSIPAGMLAALLTAVLWKKWGWMLSMSC